MKHDKRIIKLFGAAFVMGLVACVAPKKNEPTYQNPPKQQNNVKAERRAARTANKVDKRVERNVNRKLDRAIDRMFGW